MNDTIANPTRTGKQISIRLFGAFRQFGDDSAVQVTVPDNARMADLRQALQDHFADNENALSLLAASAFATDRAVLDEDDRLPRDEPLAILPPVCGG